MGREDNKRGDATWATPSTGRAASEHKRWVLPERGRPVAEVSGGERGGLSDTLPNFTADARRDQLMTLKRTCFVRNNNQSNKQTNKQHAQVVIRSWERNVWRNHYLCCSCTAPSSTGRHNANNKLLFVFWVTVTLGHGCKMSKRSYLMPVFSLVMFKGCVLITSQLLL